MQLRKKIIDAIKISPRKIILIVIIAVPIFIMVSGYKFITQAYQLPNTTGEFLVGIFAFVTEKVDHNLFRLLSGGGLMPDIVLNIFSGLPLLENIVFWILALVSLVLIIFFSLIPSLVCSYILFSIVYFLVSLFPFTRIHNYEMDAP